MTGKRSGVGRRVRGLKASVRAAKGLAAAVAANPAMLSELGRGLFRRGGERAVPAADPSRTPPAGLDGFARTASAVVDVAATPAATRDALMTPSRWPEWLALHDGWRGTPPEVIEPGTSFVERVKVLGIPADIEWTVAATDDATMRMDGAGPMGTRLTLWGELAPIDGGTRVWVDAGLDGDPVKGPMGASVARGVQEALTESVDSLAAHLGGSAGSTRRPAHEPVLHQRTGTMLDPRTPVLIGAGQVVQRDVALGDGPLDDPVELSVRALRRAGEDSGTGEALLRGAHAVYAVASASWPYRDQAALVAQRLGATPKETVQSVPFGGDAAQLLVNAAAQSIADGEVDVVLVTGAEAGATLAAAQRRGSTPEWPVQPSGVAPTRVLGVDRQGSNEAETSVGLGAPIYVYALLESAVRARAGEDAEQHRKATAELWSRFSEVAAGNPYAWQPRAFSADELTEVTEDNRMISTPYPKLLCANLQVDLASGLILCSAAAAEAAGVPQDKWVFVHAGASAHDEWFVSERAELAASPAINAIGAAALRHAGVAITDVAHVDLYACFPSAVRIAARELGLPTDDPARPLTVTGGLTFAGGPGNNYGSHAIATLVGKLRAEPDAFGLSTSLGWYVTKHAIGVYSARPPARPHRDLRPAVEHPPARPVTVDYTGKAVIEAYTVPHGRDGEPEAAIVSALAPDGTRVLVRSEQPEIIAAALDTDLVGRRADIAAPGALKLGAVKRVPLPPPPPAPVLVERRGPITVITLNRPEVRNAVNLAMARALERAIDAFEADANARVAVLTGTGGAFCAGMDLKAAARGEFPITERRGPLGLAGKPPAKPLIAAVEGPALAGGCELALAADLIVASRESVFGIPEAKRGLVAAGGGVLRLSQRLPRNVAMELALTAEPMTALRCAELGLVNRVAEPGAVLEDALALAESIAANAPLSVAISKRIVDESPDWSIEEAFDRQTALSASALMSEDAAEGIRAFTEKRDPIWRGR